MSEYRLVPVEKELDEKKIVIPKEFIPNNDVNNDMNNDGNNGVVKNRSTHDFLSIPKKITAI